MKFKKKCRTCLLFRLIRSSCFVPSDLTVPLTSKFEFCFSLVPLQLDLLSPVLCLENISLMADLLFVSLADTESKQNGRI